jgi:hypothetical protein
MEVILVRTTFDKSRGVREITARMTLADSTNLVELFIVPANARLLDIVVTTIDNGTAIDIGTFDTGDAFVDDDTCVGTTGIARPTIETDAPLDFATSTTITAQLSAAAVCDITFILSIPQDTRF